MNQALLLAETQVLNFRHPDVLHFVKEHTTPSMALHEKIQRLFAAVRDSIWYTPYSMDLTKKGLSAAETLERGHGFCISKAVLLAATLRSLGLPTALGFSRVKNHQATEKYRSFFQTDIFPFHGFVYVLVENRWILLTPAFNREWYERYHLPVPEYQPFQPIQLPENDHTGKPFFQYEKHFGAFPDVPHKMMLEEFAKTFPHLPVNRQEIYYNAEDYS